MTCSLNSLLNVCAWEERKHENCDCAEVTGDCHNQWIYLFILFIQFINQQWHRSTSNDIEIQTKNILVERPTQG